MIDPKEIQPHCGCGGLTQFSEPTGDPAFRHVYCVDCLTSGPDAVTDEEAMRLWRRAMRGAPEIEKRLAEAEPIFKVWREVQDFLAAFEEDKMSLGLEYSSVVDWVADFVPRRNHPLSRQYGGPFQISGGNWAEALRAGMAKTREMMASR